MAYTSSPGRYLCISDLQAPFEHKKALEFCKDVQRHFRIPKENVYNVGDETDQLYGGMWKKDINARHTALSEISETKERFAKWFEVFPIVHFATSNHGTRWMRKALESEIPDILMRRYEEVLGCPKTWVWQKHWKVKAKHPFIVEHGDDWGGATPHLQAALHNGISTVIGHHHSKAGIEFIRTNHQALWGVVSGCLIDFEAYAFNYARNAKFKPIISVTVILDDGLWPVLVPMP